MPKIFAKTAAAADLPRFQAEADGLAALRATGAVRVPAVIDLGVNSAGAAFIHLEWLDLQPLQRNSGAALGRALARLHQTHGPQPGWPTDNFIGATLQRNVSCANWPLFFARQRLIPQLQHALANDCGRTLFDCGMRLAERIPALFSFEPAPSLLHGDLWGGNAAALAAGEAVIFDPAVYWGDREADLAMTELFGGFPEAFYAAYRDCAPLSAEYETHKTLYNLYHILNHFNLFGASYLNPARRMIERLLAELR